MNLRGKFVSPVFKYLGPCTHHALSLNRIIFASDLRAEKMKPNVIDYLVISPHSAVSMLEMILELIALFSVPGIEFT